MCLKNTFVAVKSSSRSGTLLGGEDLVRLGLGARRAVLGGAEFAFEVGDRGARAVARRVVVLGVGHAATVGVMLTLILSPVYDGRRRQPQPRAVRRADVRPTFSAEHS